MHVISFSPSRTRGPESGAPIHTRGDRSQDQSPRHPSRDRQATSLLGLDIAGQELTCESREGPAEQTLVGGLGSLSGPRGKSGSVCKADMGACWKDSEPNFPDGRWDRTWDERPASGLPLGSGRPGLPLSPFLAVPPGGASGPLCASVYPCIRRSGEG